METDVKIAENAKTDCVRHDNRHGGNDRDLDQAFWYLRQTEGENTSKESAEYHRQLRRKIDWHIVPIMFCCYTMQFIDKVLLNYAAVMGLNKDLKLRGNNFSNAATAFFIAYLCAEVPNAIILQKIPVAKWLGCNVVLWGIVTACTAAAHDYHSLLAVRIFLGTFEAAIAPSLMLISSQWYTKSEQAPRFSIWYAGLGLGQIIGGIVSYAFQHVKHHPSFTGWRIMFVVLGLVTVVVGFMTILILPDTPMNAHFLFQHEKVCLLKHVAENRTGISMKSYRTSQIREVAFDLQLWFLTLITTLISISSGVVTTYSATLISHFGFSPSNSALLNTPSGVVSIASTLAVGYGIRYTSNRWAWLIACCIPGILGGGLLSFATHNRAAQLAGIYLVNSITATLIILYQWTASNVAGATKRVISVTLISGSFSVGNIIGPQTFQARDAPQYVPAKITVLATQATAALVTFLLFLYYRMANRIKNERAGAVDRTEEQLWENRTDKQDPTFKYVY